MVPARLAVPAALSIVGGYVDVICYIRYSTFVATMTGNLVITGQTFFEVVHDLTGLHNGNLPPAPEPIRAHRRVATVGQGRAVNQGTCREKRCARTSADLRRCSFCTKAFQSTTPGSF